MLTPHAAVPGGVGFFYLFDLPATVFNPDVLQKLGAAMASAGIASGSPIDSGYVYLSQFISHDISRRVVPPAGPEFNLAGQLEQQRTPQLDLDNVYGDGFYDSSIAVDETTGEMLLGRVIGEDLRPASFDDLPRGPGLTPRIADSRDDENLLVAQLHVQFLKLHNFLVQRLRAELPQRTPVQLFEEARRRLILLYQDVVLHDFLRAVLDSAIWDQVIRFRRHHLWQPVRAEMARMPIEFAAAVFRFAHAMVRPRYSIRDVSSLDLNGLFEMTGTGSFGQLPGLPGSFVVDWRLFFSDLCPEDELPVAVNKALRIAPTVSVATPEGSLSELDLRTGNRSLMPCAQDIVDRIRSDHPALGLTRLSAQDLNPAVRIGNAAQVKLLSLLGGNEPDSYGFSGKSPLWYYILCEAFARHDGDRLGPLGSQITAETLQALVHMGAPSVLHEDLGALDIGIEPTGQEVDGRRHYKMIDLLMAVDPQRRKVERPVSEPRSPPQREAEPKVLNLPNAA